MSELGEGLVGDAGADAVGAEADGEGDLRMYGVIWGVVWLALSVVGRGDGVRVAPVDATPLSLSLTRRDGPTRSEMARNRETDHPAPSLMETRRVDGV